MDAKDFKEPLMLLLAESYGLAEPDAGHFLDAGDAGLFSQIADLDATLASDPVLEGQETIAGHCRHLLYTFQFFLAAEAGRPMKTDWPASWLPPTVDEAEWDRLRADLRAAHDELIGKFQAREDWPPPAIGAGLSLLAHTCYHVGVIDKLIPLARSRAQA